MVKIEELRDKIYDWSLELVQDGKKMQGIFLLLATWNFAYFRYHMREFKLSEFEKCLDSCNFEFFNGKTFEETNLDDEHIKEKILQIYKALADFKGIRYVGATKIMYLMCPKFFIMWDNKIRVHYGFSTSPDDYFNFLKRMRQDYSEGTFKKIDGVTIARAIDLYNITHFSSFSEQ